ncbi:hypothetical protein MMC22_001951, partial [Lobaria immixta]|nr:hypothetical protein [Lobaria immixta]
MAVPRRRVKWTTGEGLVANKSALGTRCKPDSVVGLWFNQIFRLSLAVTACVGLLGWGISAIRGPKDIGTLWKLGLGA